jgi:hypothetical protein
VDTGDFPAGREAFVAAKDSFRAPGISGMAESNVATGGKLRFKQGKTLHYPDYGC